MSNQNIKTKQGFTIIEVVLVLAIAGLIFLMVFIALPQLQRAQRDTQRRSDLARVATAITQFQTNNNGKLPIQSYGGTSTSTCSNVSNPSTYTVGRSNRSCNFLAKYMNSSTATSNEFIDPDGTPYTIRMYDQPSRGTMADTFNHIIYIYSKAKCKDEVVDNSNNVRDYAILYKLEGSGTICIDSQ